MINQSIESLKMSYSHRGKTPYVKLKALVLGHPTQQLVLADELAELAGVSRQTIRHWCEGRHLMPKSAKWVFVVKYLGCAPWPGFDGIRAKEAFDHNGNRCWGFVAKNWRMKVLITPAILNYMATGIDETQFLRNEINTLRQTINALTTRKAPPLPCAEIIPFEHYTR